jgi:hypothetical protein
MTILRIADGYSLRREKELTKNSGSSAGKMFGASLLCKFCLSAMIQATSWNPKLGIGAVWLWHEFDLLSVQIS